MMHIKHTRHTQFYAPTEASKKEFWLYPAIILRLFVLNKNVGHFSLNFAACNIGGAFKSTHKCTGSEKQVDWCDD